MMRLVRSEFLRLLSRRIVRVLGIIASIGLLVGSLIAALNSRPSSPLFLSQLPNFLKGIAFFLMVIGLMIGASSVGADWQQSTFGTLLVWEPRRVRILLIRACVIVVVVFALSLLLEALFGLAIAFAAAWRGSTAGFPDAWMRSLVGTAARIGITSAIVAVIGAAIASIGRHTAAALGAVFVYLAVVEAFFRGLVPKWTPNMLSSGLVIFVDGRAGDPGNGSVLSVERALVTMLLYSGLLLIAALVLLRSRDVN
jgi:hypothetical protein